MGLLAYFIIPALSSLRWEGCKLEASLGYLVRLSTMTKIGAQKMIQPVRMLAAKTEELNLVPRTHMVDEP